MNFEVLFLNLVLSPSCLKGRCKRSSNFKCGCFASLFCAIPNFRSSSLVVLNPDVELSTYGVCSNYILSLCNKTNKTFITIRSFLFCPKSSSKFPLLCLVLSQKAIHLLRSSGQEILFPIIYICLQIVPDFKFVPVSRKRTATLCIASSNG